MMHFPPTKFEAILDLVGNDKEFSVTPEGEFIWKEDNDGKPSESEIQTRLTELTTEWDAQAYARKRANSYPSITNVTIALAEKAEGRSAMWDEITAQRLDVKSKFPKP